MVIENQLASAPTNGSVVLWDIKKNTKSKLGKGVAWNKRGVAGHSGHDFLVPPAVLKLLFSSSLSPSLPLSLPPSLPPSLPSSSLLPSLLPPLLSLSSLCIWQDPSES